MTNEAATIGQGHAKLNGLIARSALVAVSTFALITLHELIHLVVGRVAGIPAVFTSLTSAGIPPGIDAHRYGGLQLALMNGIAPLLTVITGFAVYCLMSRRRSALNATRYFFAWWAIFGIPYLGVQMMLVVQHVDYSGNGADSAAVAGYLHLSMPVRAVICGIGFLYYLAAARGVLGVIRANDNSNPCADWEAMIAAWRYVLGGLLVAVAIAGIGWYIARESRGMSPGPGFGVAFMAWAAASATFAAWRNPAVRDVAKHWLLPGIIGMVALFPLGLLDNGDDYATIWLPVLPPVVAAAMLAGQRAPADRVPARPAKYPLSADANLGATTPRSRRASGAAS